MICTYNHYFPNRAYFTSYINASPFLEVLQARHALGIGDYQAFTCPTGGYVVTWRS